MNNQQEIGEIVCDYLERYPSFPSRRIAKMICMEAPQYELEQVRTRVRYYRGQHGVENRTHGDGKFFDQKYDLPLPSVYDSSEFIIPEKTVLILSDLQIPFHDNQAIGAAIDWAADYSSRHSKIEAILLNGDVLDVYQLSSFSRDPRERTIATEVENTKDFLEVLKESFGVPIYFKYGNHEERYERYLYSRAAELVGIRGTTLEDALDLKSYGAIPIRDKRIVKIGQLHIIHGHEYKSVYDPVNPARTFFLKAKATTLGGDKHKTSEHSERNIKRELVTCWSTGCLCDLRPKYMPLNNWNHGFALVKNDGETFRVVNLRIENGVVY